MEQSKNEYRQMLYVSGTPYIHELHIQGKKEALFQLTTLLFTKGTCIPCPSVSQMRFYKAGFTSVPPASAGAPESPVAPE